MINKIKLSGIARIKKAPTNESHNNNADSSLSHHEVTELLASSVVIYE